jgi:predicted GNAT family acetyltransferase
VHITITDDLGQFTATAGSWLAAAPVENNVLLSAIEAQRAEQIKGTGRVTYAWASDNGSVLGALRWPQPLPATMTAMPDSAAIALAAELAAAAAELAGITGPRQPAAAFATRWQALTGQTANRVRDLVLSHLDQVKFSDWPPGRMRRARPEETDLLVEWITKVLAEAGLPAAGPTARQQVAEQMSGGRMYVWEDNGQPVAVTGHAAPVNGVVRISGGYTAPEHRTSFYSLALLAALDTQLLADGCVACIGITDTASPHAAVGMRMLGYQPVMELSAYRFQPAEGH